MKGLKPYIEDGISTYTDAKGNQYVRVKEDGEDFCIAAHDYVKAGKSMHTWDKAMEMLKDKGLTTFTKEQAALYDKYHSEINHKLKEINGKIIPDHEWYWTITEVDTKHACCFRGEGDDNSIYDYPKNIHINVRPIINL